MAYIEVASYSQRAAAVSGVTGSSQYKQVSSVGFRWLSKFPGFFCNIIPTVCSSESYSVSVYFQGVCFVSSARCEV